MTVKGNLPHCPKRGRKAKAILGRVAKNGDPLQERRAAKATEQNTLKAVAEEYLAREGKNLRSRTLGGKRDVFRLHVFPKFASRPIDSIKRSEIVRLLDKVEDEAGPYRRAAYAGEPTAADELVRQPVGRFPHANRARHGARQGEGKRPQPHVVGR